MKTMYLPMLALLALTACNNKSASEGNVEKDSVSTTNIEDERSEDHYAIWQMDSANEVNFKTADLMAFEASGHVKKIKWNNQTIKFDKEGNITQMYDECGEYQVGHPEEGCVSTYCIGGGSNTYQIDAKNQRVEKLEGGEGDYMFENIYAYDENGVLVKMICTEESGDMYERNKTTNTFPIKILKTDAHNNWIKRKFGDEVQTRVITYYENPLGDEDTSDDTTYNPYNEQNTFIGTVGGYKDCVLSFNAADGEIDLGESKRSVCITEFKEDASELTLAAYLPSGPYCGKYEGTVKMVDGKLHYKGTFTNTKDAKVPFDLVKQ